MSDLVTFLLARIDEDEVAARAAAPGPWEYQDVDSVGGGRVCDPAVAIADLHYEQPGEVDPRIRRTVLSEEADGTGEHIARHDPTRVLAECEAKRRIIALHEEWPVLIQTEPTIEAAPDLGNFAYRASQQIGWATNREYVARFGTEAPTAAVLLALALPYADHPDFDPSWRP